MARLITIGFETQTPASSIVGPENPPGAAITGPVTRDTTVQRSGGACIKCDSGSPSGPTYTPIFSISASKTYYMRAYMRFGTLPSVTAPVFGFLFAANFGISVWLTSAGKLQLFNNVTSAQIGSDSAATIAINTYYRIELNIVLNASTQITSGELRLDGVTVASFSGLTIAASLPTVYVGWLDTPGTNNVFCYVDDVAINDSTGTVNNTWCGPGAVVLLLPTADNAVGTNWTRGNGTVISGGNGFQSVDNTPPIGVADLSGAGADSSQLRNAGSNANSNYDATMQTYTAAGVPAGATINAIIPWVWTGAPVVTSAKLGTFGVVSNPTIASVSFAAGGTAGAFWSGVAAGTFPTGWKPSSGTVTENPSVTLGTAPVMRVTQVTSSTRIAMFCFMGMYVDYTPAAVARSLVTSGMARPQQARQMTRWH